MIVDNLYTLIALKHHRQPDQMHGIFIMECLKEKHLSSFNDDMRKEVGHWVMHQIDHLSDKHPNADVQYVAYKIIHDIYKSLGLPCPFHKPLPFDVFNVQAIEVLERYYLWFSQHFDDDASIQLCYLLDAKITTILHHENHIAFLNNVLLHLDLKNKTVFLYPEEQELYDWLWIHIRQYNENV